MDRTLADVFASQTTIISEIIKWVTSSINADENILIHRLYEIRIAAINEDKLAALAPIDHLIKLLECDK